jgi:hypothetical protein
MASRRSSGILVPGALAEAVGAGFDALEGFVDLIEGVLFLAQEAEGEVAVIGVTAGIRLMHAEGGGVAVFIADGLAGDAFDGIEVGVPQFDEALLLLLEEGRHFHRPLGDFDGDAFILTCLRTAARRAGGRDRGALVVAGAALSRRLRRSLGRSRSLRWFAAFTEGGGFLGRSGSFGGGFLARSLRRLCGGFLRGNRLFWQGRELSWGLLSSLV